MLSFRRKILFSYLALFLVFLALMFPFASKSVKSIITKAMTDRADELITKIQSAPNDDALVRRLKDQKHLIFFRVSIISAERTVIYDSHTKRSFGPKFTQEYVLEHPEVIQAFDQGMGYSENYSDLMGQKFIYIAKRFNFQSSPYVMRVAFPHKYMQELTRNFEIGFLSLATLVLTFFSIMTWVIIHHLSAPIQQIIDGVRPYQQGESKVIPEIVLASGGAQDEFGRLAHTLNSLSRRVQKQIEAVTRERNEKESILESLIEGVIAVNPHLNITYANQTASTLLNLDEQMLIGRHFLVTQQHECHELLVRCQQEHQVLSQTLRIRQGGQKLFLDVIAVPNGKNSGAILVLQDNSTHYQLIEMRKDFVANASHELKTPITIIRGFAETLHDNPQLPASTQQEITEKIVRNCERMHHLVRDLLALADIERLPSSRLLRCDLPTLVEAAIHTVQSVFPDAAIELICEVEGEVDVTADPQLLEQALSNLMDNAAKYSHHSAEITVTIDKQSTGWRIRIQDRGMGIPEEDLPFIFHRFYTVDKSHSRSMGGSGLGLSIVETIIEKHGGTIHVESEVNVGTLFTLVLPYQFGSLPHSS